VILGNTIDSAVKLQYPAIEDLSAFNATGARRDSDGGPDPRDFNLGTRDLILKWDESGQLSDVTALLGSILTRRSQAPPVTALDLPSWDFSDGSGQKGWLLENELEAGAAGEASLSLFSVGSDPYLYSPALDVDPTGVGELRVQMSASCGERQESVCDLFWRSDEDPEFDEVKRARIRVDLGAGSSTYLFDLGRNLTWLLAERVTGLRLDPVDCAGSIRIESITFVAQGVQ
jgi:hypothetical protein